MGISSTHLMYYISITSFVSVTELVRHSKGSKSPNETCPPSLAEWDMGGGGGELTAQYHKQLGKYRNMAIKLPNTTILQYRVKTQCHTETTNLYVTFRANIAIKNLLMNIVR